jgi:hypothetical protein
LEVGGRDPGRAAVEVALDPETAFLTLERAVNPSKKFNYETREIREKEEKIHHSLR